MNKVPFQSRRSVLGGIARLLAAAASCGLVFRKAAAQQEQKVSQAEAKYRNQPNGQQRCEICLQFEPPQTCKIVQGRISPKGWCQFFAAREGAR